MRESLNRLAGFRTMNESSRGFDMPSLSMTVAPYGGLRPMPSATWALPTHGLPFGSGILEVPVGHGR